MASKPKLSEHDDHLKPNTEAAERTLRNVAGDALRHAAWMGDDTEAVEYLKAACQKAWPKYYGQKEDTDFSHVNFEWLLARERKAAQDFERTKKELDERIAGDHENAYEILEELIQKDASLPHHYDQQLLEYVASQSWEDGDGLDHTLNPLRQTLSEGHDPDETFTDTYGDVQERHGRVLLGNEAGKRMIKWNADRPGYQVHSSLKDAEEVFQEMHKDLNPEDYYRDMHDY